MKIIVKNRSNQSMSHMGPYLKSFLPFAQKRLGFNRPPTIFFDSDPDNSKKVLGKTAHYDPEALEVVVYIDKRHPKDILRSLSHELVHHSQNCRGDLEPEIAGETGPGYAQTNPHMRQMESEAFEKGNLCMRDWEDKVKIQLSMQVELQETNYLHITGDSHKMATYEQLKEQITKKVVEALKEKMNNNVEEAAKPDFLDLDKDGDKKESMKKAAKDKELEEGEAFAPNHYCVHHGGVQHEGKIHMAEAVGHNWSKKSQRVTHYDMKLEDGSVLKNVAFENIQVTEASLAEKHDPHSMKRDDEEEIVKEAGYDPDREIPSGGYSDRDMFGDGDAREKFVEAMAAQMQKKLVNTKDDGTHVVATFEDGTKGYVGMTSEGAYLDEFGRGMPISDPAQAAAKLDAGLKERKKRNNPRNDRGMSSRMKMNEEELDEEEEIVNEEENETDVNLNESNDHWYQKQLFEKLSKRWTK